MREPAIVASATLYPMADITEGKPVILEDNPLLPPPKTKDGNRVRIRRKYGKTLAEFAVGVPRRKAAKVTGLTDSEARVIHKASGLSVDEFQAAQMSKLQEVADMALKQTKDTLHKASALQSATVYGIIHDKINHQGRQVNQTLHLHLKDGDRGGILSSLLGKHAERLVPRHLDRISTDGSKSAPLPVIEVDLAPVQAVSPAPLSAVDSKSLDNTSK